MMLPDQPSDQVEHFDVVHGLGSYERCRAAAVRVMRHSRVIGIADLKLARLEREGIPTTMAAAYLDLVRGPKPSLRRLRPEPHHCR
jgi:hypothetical protein